MATEKTNETPYEAKVRAEIRASSWRGVAFLNDLKALNAVAEAWRANNGNQCPTPQRLARSSNLYDAWGDPYEIRCTSDATTAVSWGPDKKAGTEDDLTFPGDWPKACGP